MLSIPAILFLMASGSLALIYATYKFSDFWFRSTMTVWFGGVISLAWYLWS